MTAFRTVGRAYRWAIDEWMCSAQYLFDVLRDVRAFVGGRDINHNDANLLPCLNITVSVGDLIERISSIDDRAKLTRLHAGFQELDKCVAAASGRQGNEDP